MQIYLLMLFLFHKKSCSLFNFPLKAFGLKIANRYMNRKQFSSVDSDGFYLNLALVNINIFGRI